MKHSSLNLFIVAGEASSDYHAAQLLKEFKRLHPEVHAYGVGGKKLEEEGMEIIVPAASISAFGATDWFDRVGEIWKSYKKTVETIEKRPADLALLLDLPDFNLRIAKKLKARKIPTAYYFSPQVWAWRKYRVQKIKNLINKMLVAFPFEKKFYEENGVSVNFVGHPVLEHIEARKHFRSNSEIGRTPRIALLPGSRKSELKEHGPILNGVVKKLLEKYPNAELRVPVANTLSKTEVKKVIGNGVDFTEGGTSSVLEWADVALVASGTATLECAVIGTPFALFYKVSPSSAVIYRWFIPYKGPIGMPNILLEKETAKEFFQEEATTQNLFTQTVELLENEEKRIQLGKELLKCRDKLGGKGASQRAAFQLHRLLQEVSH